jgi:tetratricopeptide (TPR) repeat protein
VADVKLGLAWLDVLDGNVAGTESHLRQAVALCPNSPRAHQVLFEFLLWQGRRPEAVAALQARMGLEEPRAGDYFLLAGLLVELGRYEEAAEHYRSCLALAPGSPEARYNLGALLRRMHRPGEAVEHLRAARQLAPGDPATNVELALSYADGGDIGEALRVLREALSAGVEDADERAELEALAAKLERARQHERPQGHADPP